MTTLVWFRQDLRLHDNLALHSLSERYENGAIPIYVKDPLTRVGSASDWWLEQSLESLNASLKSSLKVYSGDANKILEDIITENNISHVVWNKCYNPTQDKIDCDIKQNLMRRNVLCEEYNSSLLWDPNDPYLLNNYEKPYQVFTHFYKNAVKYAPRKPVVINDHKINWKQSITKNNLDHGLQSKKWHKKFHSQWKIGEQAALDKLNHFLSNGIKNYKDGRNNLNYRNVSQLSPHIHFGEISVNYIWHRTIKSIAPQRDKDHFHSELGWREFAHYIMHHFNV